MSEPKVITLRCHCSIHNVNYLCNGINNIGQTRHQCTAIVDGHHPIPGVLVECSACPKDKSWTQCEGVRFEVPPKRKGKIIGEYLWQV